MTKRKQLEPKRQDNAIIYQDESFHQLIKMKHLTSFKKSPELHLAASVVNNENLCTTDVALKPDLVPKQENVAGTQSFGDSTNLLADDKTEFLATKSPEKISHFSTDLPVANSVANKYEQPVTDNVNIYDERKVECNKSNNTRHRQQKVRRLDEITSQEMKLAKYSEVKHGKEVFQPSESLTVTTTECLETKTKPVHTRSEHSFHRQSPSTTNESPNFVKKLESFVDTVRQLESDRYETSCHMTLPKEILSVKSVVNTHLIAEQQNGGTSVTYADGNNDEYNLPLDLSKKPNKYSERLSERYEPVIDSSEMSSLACLEQKFGANSTILERIGVQPNAAPSSKSRFYPGNSFLENCFPKRLVNSTVSGFPASHSAGSGPFTIDKEQSHHSLKYQMGTFSHCKTNTTETQRNIPRSSGEFQNANGRHPSQYLHSETILQKTPTPCTQLRCSCGSVFGLWSLLMAHVRESGHSLLGTKINDTKSSPGMGFGQRLRAKPGYDNQPYVPQCIECGRSFQSLPELTIHMIQMAHYLNLVHSNMIHHRPSSVCSASTLDSYEGIENSSSEQSGYEALRANTLTTSEWSELPDQAQTADLTWSSLSADRLLPGHSRPVTTPQKEYTSRRGNSVNSECRLKTLLERESASQIKPGHSRSNVPTVKLEVEEHMVSKNVGNSPDFGSESRSSYSNPSFQNDIEMTESGPESNLNYRVQNASYTTQTPLNGVYNNRWNENQTAVCSNGNVSALVAMQNFVQRSFSSFKDLELDANSVCHKQPSLLHLTQNFQWHIPKSSWQNAAPTQTTTHKRKRQNQTKDSKISNPSEIRPNTGHQKRKGAGKSRNLSYWKNLAINSEKRNDSARDRTSELLRKQRITSWQCTASELFNSFTFNTVRSSSVDGILLAKKTANELESTYIRKRHHSSDVQNISSADDKLKFCTNNLEDPTGFKTLIKHRFCDSSVFEQMAEG